jgi:hypothetical protein
VEKLLVDCLRFIQRINGKLVVLENPAGRCNDNQTQQETPTAMGCSSKAFPIAEGYSHYLKKIVIKKSKLIDKLSNKAMVEFDTSLINSAGKVVVPQSEESLSIQLFAKLIIEECANVIRVNGDDYSYYNDLLMKHFYGGK